jgi:hypothetical protein
MRSQIRFIQHPNDEFDFVREIISDDSVQLIDGPRWKAKTPQTFRSMAEIQGAYCIVWSSLDRPALSARYIQDRNDWYCDAEMVTIQFLRSQCIDSIITEGRIAISTNDAAELETKGVERRYKFLSKFIRKNYQNSVVCWYNPDNPIAPGTAERSANPSAADPRVWVGPYALHWLQENRNRRIRQFKNAGAYAHLLDQLPL